MPSNGTLGTIANYSGSLGRRRLIFSEIVGGIAG
jgi:hypothetical protein